MVVKLLVILGTYEKSLCGVDFVLNKDSSKKKISFSIPAHVGYVKAIGSGPRFLVSGSTDETVRIFDLNRRKDFGSLTCHSGSVSALAFYRQKMLFSGGEDGKIMVTRCADWETIMTLKAHSGGVSTIAVHPSGKLALSSGKDKMVKTWNLVTGKIALKLKMPHQVDRIVWSPSGSLYAFISERHVQVFQTDGALNMLDHVPNKKVLTGLFVSDDCLLIAGEGSDILVYSIGERKWTVVSTKHTPRIKDIQGTEGKDGAFYVASGSSDGLCCLWKCVDDHNLSLLVSERTTMRITCLSITTQ